MDVVEYYFSNEEEQNSQLVLFLCLILETSLKSDSPEIKFCDDYLFILKEKRIKYHTLKQKLK